MNKNINPWKIATYILTLLIVILLVYQGVTKDFNSRYKELQKKIIIGNLEIPETYLTDLYKYSKPGEPMNVCSFKDNICVKIMFKAKKS